MKKKLLTSLMTLVTLLLMAGGSSAQKIGYYACKWNTGVPPENKEDLVNRMQLDEKSQFLFLLSNDDKNLYVDLMVAEKAAVQKIMRYGLTTWLNPEGKSKKAMGIQFPVSPEEKSQPDIRGERGGDRKDMRMAMMASKNQEMLLIGFEGKGSRKYIDPRIDGSFHGKLEMMEDGMIWVSLSLPLDKIGQEESSPFSLGFETGYMDLNKQGMPSGGGQQSGGGMHGGGGMYGGGPPPGGSTQTATAEQQQRPDISALASPSKLWIKQVILALKP